MTHYSLHTQTFIQIKTFKLAEFLFKKAFEYFHKLLSIK